MIQLDYTTPNTEQSVYISTEDNRIDTSVAKTQVALLFEITNDMSGSVVYTYLLKIDVDDRYTTGTLTPKNTSPDMFSGQFIALPVGYYDYNVFELTTQYSAGSVSYNCNTLPPTSAGVLGKVIVDDPSGTEVYTQDLTGKNDVYTQEIDRLSAGTYNMDIKNTCDSVIYDGAFIVGTDTAQADNTRFVEIQNVVQTTTGITFDIASKMPVGHSYGFSVGSASETQITNITSVPQTTSHSFAQIGNPTLAANLVECKQYNQTGGAAGGGTIVGSTLNIRPLKNPSDYYGVAIVLASNNVLNSTGGTELKTGNVFISAIYGASSVTTNPQFYVLQGQVTEGKMYISQKDTTLKEVTYKEHEEPAGTNYIYYGQ